MAKKSRLEMLQDVAKDLNKVLKLKPAIPIDADSSKELKAAILVEMNAEGGQLYNTDKEMLETDTWEYLTETLDIEPNVAPGSGDTVDPEDAVPEKEPKKGKAKAAKTEEKEDKPKTEKEDKKVTKNKKKDADNGDDKYPREQAICDTMQKKFMTTTEIAEAANAAYVKAGGKDNVDQTKRLVGRYIKPFRFLGILQEKDGKFKVNI